MSRCPSCGRDVPENQRFCGECGAPTDAPVEVTRTSVDSAHPGDVTRDPQSGARFLPGSMIAGRYRVVGLLGRGGMGEVYRADDLKLGQPVALKLLPREFENDPARLERFLNEVRHALRVTHPNICRVFDVGEVDGQHYLSMEYVDGEDLASLLRRIGRLPQDKAVEIARQLCAGLAAAHGEGILHRDLKPANVMIDGRGRAKITDFGLAGATRGIAGAEARAGTPGYMAPEQLSGESLTERTDVYALGLLLYELFTGKKAYPADSAAEMARLQREVTPTSLSSHVDGIDPAVERVIRRCLEPDANDRPAGALSVAAALPGGDPLAAALAAGETPSPEMVAAAGETGALTPTRAVAGLGFFLAALALLVSVAPHHQLVRLAPADRPTQALVVDAREIVEDLGYDAEPVDRTWGFYYSGAYGRWMEDREDSTDRWDDVGNVRPRPLVFWYRESPRPLVPMRYQGSASSTNPPVTITGMVRVLLDTEGNLQELLAVPPEKDDTDPPEAGHTAWERLFAHAGLALADFTPAAPEWVPPRYADVRRAWTGTYPDRPDTPIRVEAASYRGRPVYFEVVAPWTQATGMAVRPLALGQRIVNIFLLGLLTLMLVGGGLLVRRNRRLGRIDVRGATRLASLVFAATILAWLLDAHHVASLAEVGIFMLGVAPQALLVAGLVVLVYLALEPYVRKLWPEAMISWSRLLSGRFRDPRVGRDILLGTAVAVAMNLVVVGIEMIPRVTGAAGTQPLPIDYRTLRGIRQTLALLPDNLAQHLFITLAILFLILALRAVLRRGWAAYLATGGILMAIVVLQNPEVPYVWVLGGLYWLLFLGTIVRLGLLAAVVAMFVQATVLAVPMGWDLSTWYVGRSWLVLGLIVALAVWGFRQSLAGRSLIPATPVDGSTRG